MQRLEQKNGNNITRHIVLGAVVAAVYAASTLFLWQFSHGALQVRVSEALTILPIFFPEAIAGLGIGCFLANLLGGAHYLDVIFGSLATLMAAWCTWKLRRYPYAAALPPVLFNMAITGPIVYYCYGAESSYSLIITVVFIGLGQLIAVYGLGFHLLHLLRRLPYVKKLQGEESQLKRKYDLR